MDASSDSCLCTSAASPADHACVPASRKRARTHACRSLFFSEYLRRSVRGGTRREPYNLALLPAAVSRARSATCALRSSKPAPLVAWRKPMVHNATDRKAHDGLVPPRTALPAAGLKPLEFARASRLAHMAAARETSHTHQTRHEKTNEHRAKRDGLCRDAPNPVTASRAPHISGRGGDRRGMLALASRTQVCGFLLVAKSV